VALGRDSRSVELALSPDGKHLFIAGGQHQRRLRRPAAVLPVGVHLPAQGHHRRGRIPGPPRRAAAGVGAAGHPHRWRRAVQLPVPVYLNPVTYFLDLLRAVSLHYQQLPMAADLAVVGVAPAL